jgi:hypothetical protein
MIAGNGKEWEAMRLISLTPRQRWLCLLGAWVAVLAAGVQVIPWALLLFRLPLSFLTSCIANLLLLNILVDLIVTAIFVEASWRGAVNQHLAKGWLGLAWVAYLGVVACASLFMSRFLPGNLPAPALLFGLIVLLYAAVASVRHRLAQAEWRNAQKLLEIESSMAAIKDALAARSRLTLGNNQ